MEDFDIISYLMGQKAGKLSSYPTDTASGSPANFPDGADGVPVVDLSVAINPAQEGSGDPSPSNVRPISGWTGLTLYHSGSDTSDPETLSVSWQSEAGTVYGGTLNVTTGVLTVTRVEYALTGDEPFSLASNSRRFQANLSDLGWAEPAKQPSGNASFDPDAICSHCRQWTGTTDTSFSYRFQHYNTGLNRFNFYDTGETFASASAFLAFLAAQVAGGTPVQVSYTLAVPVTYQLAPTQVRTLLGENNLWADTGDVTAEYRADLDLYIDKKLHQTPVSLGFGMASPGASPEETEDDSESETGDEDSEAVSDDNGDGEATELFDP